MLLATFSCDRAPKDTPASKAVLQATSNVEDVLAEIATLRKDLTPLATSQLIKSEQHMDAITTLVHHLQNNDRQVRLKAHEAIITLQPDCSAGPDDYAAWSQWLSELRARADSVKSVSTGPLLSERTRTQPCVTETFGSTL